MHHMAKKRKAKKSNIKRKRTAKKSKPKKWSSPKLDVFGPVERIIFLVGSLHQRRRQRSRDDGLAQP
jgi:hypothetical protein